MLSMAQNNAVVAWIQDHSNQPHKAVMAWLRMLERLDLNTGEVELTRQQLAEWVGVTPQHLSRIMTELASINAIHREKDGRRVKYYVNPHAGTHIAGIAARAAARERFGPIKLEAVESSRDVVDDDMDVIDE